MQNLQPLFFVLVILTALLNFSKTSLFQLSNITSCHKVMPITILFISHKSPPCIKLTQNALDTILQY